jgi:hypothetical protein
MRRNRHTERHDEADSRFFAILRIRLTTMCRTYVVRNEAGTSTNNITGSTYILLKPMAFCEQNEFILHYRTFNFCATTCYRTSRSWFRSSSMIILNKNQPDAHQF